MKKSKNCNLKKLALLGIAGGTILSTEAVAADTNNFSQLLAYNGCAGQNGCHGSSNTGTGSNNGGYQAYRNTPSQNSYYYSEGQPSSGCASTSPQYYQQAASCRSNQAPQYYQPSASCSNTAYAPRGETYNSTSSQYSNQPGMSSTTNPNTYQQQPQTQSKPAQDQWSQPRTVQPTNPSASNQRNNSKWENSYTAETEKTTGQKMTESEVLSKLNEQGKATYQSLDPAGKALAVKLANQDCKGQNECKGMNSCKTSDHSCAGKGSCKGTAPSNFKDKNLAVKVAALKMAEKRANAASSKY